MTLHAPSCDVDFYGDATLRDPARAYRRMLDRGPVVWLTAQNMLAICGHDALTRALRDHRRFQSGQGVSINAEVNRVLIGSTLHSDPPAHDATRAITFAPLSPKALTDIRARVTDEATRLADTVCAQQEFDAARDLAPHLPLRIVRDLVGLGEAGKENMLSWGAATFELMGDPRTRGDDARQRLAALRAFLDDPSVLAGLHPDGWARRATQRGIADGMDPGRAVELMRDYIAPSLDTTISAIGYAIHLFSNAPAQWARLRADRTLIANAVEEVVRLNTPIRAFSRYVAEDVELAEVSIPKGARVLVVFGAANRDPQKFADPDRFDITRETRGHVGFGHGKHTCLGMHLARLEITALLEALADRVERFEALAPPEPALNATIHAFARVPVRAHLAGRA